MSYLLFALARLLGRAVAPTVQPSIDKVTLATSYRARKQQFEPLVRLLRDGPTVGSDGQLRAWLPREWEAERARLQLKCDHLIKDWEVVEVLLKEREADASRRAFDTKYQTMKVTREVARARGFRRDEQGRWVTASGKALRPPDARDDGTSSRQA